MYGGVSDEFFKRGVVVVFAVLFAVLGGEPSTSAPYFSVKVVTIFSLSSTRFIFLNSQ